MDNGKNNFQFIGNRKDENHETLIASLISDADEAFLISPFLFPDFSHWISSLDLESLQRLTLITTLAPRGDDQLRKPKSLLSLHNALQESFPNINLTIQINNSLHGKIYLFSKQGDITDGVVTSANLSHNGLSRNHEWGMHITDRSMLTSIWNEVSSTVKYPYISVDLLRKMDLFADHYIENHKFEAPSDIDASLYNALQNAPTISNLDQKIDWFAVSNVFFKPIGTKDEPVLIEEKRSFADISGDLNFPKGRPSDIAVQDLVVCFGTGSRCVISINRVLSNPEERSVELQEIDEHAKRWPWFIHGQNLTPQFGATWFEHAITIDSLVERFKEKYLTLPITEAGSEGIGAFNFGAGRLRLAKEFSRFVVNTILELEYASRADQPTEASEPSDSDQTLEQHFHQGMIHLYERAKQDAGYNATKLHTMIQAEGGFATAQTLISASSVSDGYTKLWEKGRIDLTVEAFVLSNEEFHRLFTAEQLTACRKRLADYGYSETS